MGGAQDRPDDLEPLTPAAFMPGGLLGVQVGGSREESKKSKSLESLSCQPVNSDDADEVCFFKSPAASLVAGAPIHDGFIVRRASTWRSLAPALPSKTPTILWPRRWCGPFRRTSMRPTSKRVMRCCS